MSAGEPGRMTDPPPSGPTRSTPSGRGSPRLPRAPLRYRGKSGLVLLRRAAAKCRCSVAYYCSAAYTSAVDLDDLGQNGRGGIRHRSLSQLVKQDELGFGMQPEVATHLKTADPFGGVDEQADCHRQGPERKLPADEQGPPRYRELPAAGLAFENTAASIGIGDKAIAIGTNRRPACVRPSHLAEHLMGTLSQKIAKINQ
jgi:hypothetical protein